MTETKKARRKVVRGSNKLTPEHRQMVRRAVAGESVAELAREYDTSRTWIYKSMAINTKDNAEKLADARDEVRFREALQKMIDAGTAKMGHGAPPTAAERAEAAASRAENGSAGG